MNATTSEAFFDSKYQADSDPWDFATNSYELSRYDRIVHALGDRRFALAYEPGCSVGVLTEKLAGVCDRVEACDLSATAVANARQRCKALENVRIRHASLSEFKPDGADLYVFSEIGYYFTHTALADLLHSHVSVLQNGAALIACHWRGVSADHLLSGDEVHEILRDVPGLAHEYFEQHEQFRLDRWAKREVNR